MRSSAGSPCTRSLAELAQMGQLGAIPAAARRVPRTLTSAQRDAALDLLRESLSVRGFDTARNVMKLNHVLGEITGNWAYFGEWVYFLCIFGEPSPDEPWGWQLDGHHLNLNYFVLGDQVVMTPGILGRRAGASPTGAYTPACASSTPSSATGLALMRALSAAQRRQAIIYDSMLDQGPAAGALHAPTTGASSRWRSRTTSSSPSRACAPMP